jgi:hypothetical protein
MSEVLTPEQVDILKKDVTHEEVAKMTRAMKDPKFRDLFQEYVNDISDPKHRFDHTK